MKNDSAEWVIEGVSNNEAAPAAEGESEAAPETEDAEGGDL